MDLKLIFALLAIGKFTLFFDNTRLAQELNSLERLKNELQMQKFLSWVRKKNPNKRIKVERKKA